MEYVNSALEIEKTEVDAKINISSPDQMNLFLEQENKMLKDMIDRISASGANVVLCQKGIDDIVQHYLAKAGIIAVKRIKESDMSKLSKATGARIVTNTDELSKGTNSTNDDVRIMSPEELETHFINLTG